jgi:penicillin amidase
LHRYRNLRRAAIALLLLVIGVATGLWITLRQSLPVLDGGVKVVGLENPVEITRDAYGVPTITAESRTDLALATGFLHAQDRFFQMDLLRRIAAGELSALIGPATLAIDRRHRLHRFRAAAHSAIDELPPADRALLEAYTQGVNAGLAALDARPFEYLVRRVQPAPWQVEDTLLVNFAMYLDLNDDDASRDASFALLHEALPPALEAFLVPEGTDWDAPLIGPAFETPPIPGPGACDLSQPEAAVAALEHADRVAPFLIEEPMAGSNAWIVGPQRSASGRAIVANDMHLQLGEPNIWYRMRWIVSPRGAADTALDITGVTLPGAPIVVAGSNGAVAWGFTNSYGDWSDLVLLELDPDDASRYRSGDEWHSIDVFEERIDVRGGDPDLLEVRSSEWGPLLDAARHGRLRAVHWLAHEPQAVNLRLVDLEQAGSVDTAVRIAHSVGSPPQNIMIADRDGNIAWTIMGRIPLRVGYDPRVPVSWADGHTGWQGWLASADYPEVRNPPSGLLWTANARTADGAALDRIGRGGYDLGARAKQIRDTLAKLERATPADMLRTQLDDRALLQQQWAGLLVELLSGEHAGNDPRRAELRNVLERWDGRAGTAAAGYRIAREFRRLTQETLLEQMVFGCGTIAEPFEVRRHFQSEGPMWQLVIDRPEHLLPPGYANWEDFLLAMADAAIAQCPEGALADCRWGAINRVDIRHPLARALPFGRYWLSINADALPGGQYMPRVQQGLHGATERFAVSPGDEANGYFHMPGGQSGHPLSPYFRAGHRAWVDGEPLPFLPGPATHALTLDP